jgi:hypothetical protein
MKVLKGFGLGVAGFLLFIALIILGFAVTLNSTVLNPEFIITGIEKLDISTTAQQILQETLPPEAEPYLPAINATLIEYEHWINKQINYAINSFYDYLFGRTNTFQINISTEQIKHSLVENLRQTYVQLPPSEQGFSFEELQQQITDEIPSSIILDQDSIPSDIWQSIQQAKEITGLIRTTYFALIVFSLALIALIILITRKVKSAALSLGIIFLVAGAASLSALIVTQQLAPGSIPMNDLPSQLHVWLKQLIIDYLSPWKIYSIAILVL